MKQFVFVILSLLLAGCGADDFLGEPEMNVQDSTVETTFPEILRSGNEYQIAVGTRNFIVTVDDIAISNEYENVNLDDTVKQDVLSVDFANAIPLKVRKISAQVVEKGPNYAIREMEFEMIIYNYNIFIPVRFKRYIVSAITDDGKTEVISDYRFEFAITSEYFRTEEADKDKALARTYYKLQIDAYDSGVFIGTINPVVSLYAHSCPITFDADLEDITEQ